MSWPDPSALREYYGVNEDHLAELLNKGVASPTQTLAKWRAVLDSPTSSLAADDDDVDAGGDDHLAKDLRYPEWETYPDDIRRLGPSLNLLKNVALGDILRTELPKISREDAAAEAGGKPTAAKTPEKKLEPKASATKSGSLLGTGGQAAKSAPSPRSGNLPSALLQFIRQSPASLFR
eukprot:g1898.t1